MKFLRWRQDRCPFCDGEARFYAEYSNFVSAYSHSMILCMTKGCPCFCGSEEELPLPFRHEFIQIDSSGTPL